jgi:hypothetical protein
MHRSNQTTKQPIKQSTQWLKITLCTALINARLSVGWTVIDWTKLVSFWLSLTVVSGDATHWATDGLEESAGDKQKRDCLRLIWSKPCDKYAVPLRNSCFDPHGITYFSQLDRKKQTCVCTLYTDYRYSPPEKETITQRLPLLRAGAHARDSWLPVTGQQLHELQETSDRTVCV